MKKRAEELIRLAVPELQELKKGCVVHFKNLPSESIIVNESELYDSFGLFNTDYPTIESYVRNDITTYCDILGSDIHLEHIILANRIKQNRMSTCLSNEAEILKKYHMGKLSFTEQSEEFYKFIVDILQ